MRLLYSVGYALFMTVFVVCWFHLGSSFASAQPPPTNVELDKRLTALEMKVSSMESKVDKILDAVTKLSAVPTSPPVTIPISPPTGLHWELMGASSMSGCGQAVSTSAGACGAAAVDTSASACSSASGARKRFHLFGRPHIR